MTTQIGDTNTDNYIIDDTSTYQLNLNGSRINPANLKVNTYPAVLSGGVVEVNPSGFEISGSIIITHTFTSVTAWKSFLKAWGYWLINKSLLTLHAESDAFGDNNIYQVPTYADPTTLTDFTGIIPQFSFPRDPGSIEVKLFMVYATGVS